MTRRNQLHASRQSDAPRSRGHSRFCALTLSAVLIASALAASSSVGAQPPQPSVSGPETPAAPPPDSTAQHPETPLAPQPEAGSIAGVVAGPDGTLFEGVHVTISQPGSNQSSANQPVVSDRTVTTDGNGQFSFAAVPAGAFQLTISGNGFATQHISGNLHPGENVRLPDITLLLSTATSEVRVTVSAQELATEELHLEEQQRVFGVIPNFYVVYAPTSPPLSSRQKFHLAWRSSIDPVTILFSGAVAGVEQAKNNYSGYGQGGQGYAKRFAANYADSVIGTFLGGAVFPSLLRQDPRYFVKGSGSVRSRTLYAIANAVICKGDNGHWQFDYSGIMGGLAAGGISNLYYPAANRTGASLTFENAALGIAGSAVGNVFQEFIVRKLTPKLPPPPPPAATSSQP